MPAAEHTVELYMQPINNSSTPCWCCGGDVDDLAANPMQWSSRIARQGVIHLICLGCASKLQTAEAIVLRIGTKLMQMRDAKQLTQEEFDRVYSGLRAEFL